MLVNHFLESTARRIPEKTALVVENARLSYGEIDAMANKLANALINIGVQQSDRVIIFLDNRVETVVAIFGVLKAGAVFSVVNPTTKADKLNFMLNHVQPVVVITHIDQLAVAVAASDEAPSVHNIIVAGTTERIHEEGRLTASLWTDIMTTQPATQPTERAIDVDLAAIVFTSGSTGHPKAVMCPHSCMVMVTISIAGYLDNTEEDVILNVLQLSASYGLYQVLVSFMVGATVVLERGFAFAFQAVQIMQREGVTGFAAVPTIWSMLLALKALRNQPLPKLRYITNAGAGLPAARALQVHETFPQAKLYLMYGQTECVRVSYLDPDQVTRRPGSCGRAIPNTQVYVVDEEDRPVKPGEVGELVIRGSHIMNGYWDDPERTAKRFRPARRHSGDGIGLPGEILLFTGDLFQMDEDGYLYFVSRTDDIIKSRGEKVAPREIEHVVYNFDGIQDAVAVGVPDEVLGEVIKLCIVPNDGATIDERKLREYCRRHLEDHMLPKYIEVWPELPKNANNKVDRRVLQAGRAAYASLLMSTV